MGGLVGLVVGIGLEIGREMEFQHADSGVDMLRPHAIPIGVCALFALIGSLIYVFWSLRR